MAVKKKARIVYVCRECGEEFARWAGRCPACESWNCLQEAEARSGAGGGSGKNGAAGGRRAKAEPLPTLTELSPDEATRTQTGLPELDRVLGGGIVPGAFILVGGEPGVGKSTLLLELARRFPGRFYLFSGEETAGQIKLRAGRMGIEGERLYISRETNLDEVCERIARDKPELAVVDSIQTMTRVDASPGSAAMLRDASMALMETCKNSRVPLIVTGHITKDGAIAGPRLMEHMVDVVLYFECDRLGHYRLLRSVKNRFGPAGEVAIFEMRDKGLLEVDSIKPERDHGAENAAGRVYSALAEGSRAIGVEVQALVTRSAFGNSRRMAEGIDNRRLVLMAAVLEKYLRINLAEFDVFANIAGGLSADEPALDLALCAAILSSHGDRPVSPDRAFLGEVGLSGEVRSVPMALARIKELTNLGFSTLFVPNSSDGSLLKEARRLVDGRVEFRIVRHVLDLLTDRK